MRNFARVIAVLAGALGVFWGATGGFVSAAERGGTPGKSGLNVNVGEKAKPQISPRTGPGRKPTIAGAAGGGGGGGGRAARAPVTVEAATASVLSRLLLWSADAGRAPTNILEVLQQVTPGEADVLSTRHIRFEVGVPVVVTVFRDVRLGADPFWLPGAGFRRTGLRLKGQGFELEGWERGFPAGEIGLGVNSLSGGGWHYLVGIRAQRPGGRVLVQSLEPSKLEVGELKPGALAYVDREERLEVVPGSLVGMKMVRTAYEDRAAGRLLGVLRNTRFPSSAHPDQVVLTWAGDPRHTQAVQWRTGMGTVTGWVEYWREGMREELPRGMVRTVMRRQAYVETIRDPYLVKDRVVLRHRAELTGLEAGTAYEYRVGDGVTEEGWSEVSRFTTAPEGKRPFSFIYMGDAQTSLDSWGRLLGAAREKNPEAAFYLIAGDLVNRGNERDDWDAFFAGCADVFRERVLVPVIGNHDCQGGMPRMYLQQFSLPRNGPAELTSGRVYSFEYCGALFVVLDSNLEPETQRAWLEGQLKGSKAKWKFVAFHHPLYSSAPKRDNADLRAVWGRVFDRYGVDMALQGHDHVYLRTYPLRGGNVVTGGGRGTTYVVSVSGSKMYAQTWKNYAAVGLSNVATYQVLEVEPEGEGARESTNGGEREGGRHGRVVYRAYDRDGAIRDQFELRK